MKKFCVALVSLFLSLGSLNIPVFADDSTETDSTETEIYIEGVGYVTYLEGDANNTYENYGVVPLAHEVCGGLTYHKMVATGWGSVYLADGSCFINNGSAWQCANCKRVMVTEGDIILGEMTTIGRWATMSCDYTVSRYGVYINIPESYGTCSSNSMSGYKFFLAS